MNIGKLSSITVILSSITAILIPLGYITYQASTVKAQVGQVSSESALMKEQIEKLKLVNAEFEKNKIIISTRISKNAKDIESINKSFQSVNELVNNSDIVRNTKDLKNVIEAVDKLEVMVKNSSVETRDLLLEYLMRNK